MEELVEETPFHCIITGPTNCGKTRYLVDQLRGPFRHVFEYVVLICPTYVNNKTYRGFARGDKRFLVVCPSDLDDVEDILQSCRLTFSGTNCLMILDDCAVSKELKKRSNEFIKLAFSGRHEGLSVWVLTQQLTSIAKPFRDNVACVIAFHNPSQVGTKVMFEDYGNGIDPDTRSALVSELKSSKYSRLCFCLRYPFDWYLELPCAASHVKEVNGDGSNHRRNLRP